MRTKYKYKNNLKEFESLLCHRHSGLKQQKHKRYGAVDLWVS